MWCLGGLNVRHKSAGRILNVGLVCLVAVVVYCHAGYMECGRMLAMTREIDAAVYVLKTADFHNLYICYKWYILFVNFSTIYGNNFDLG